MNPMMPSKEVLYFQALMDGSTVPEEEDVPAKMPEKMTQKRDNFQSIEVMGAHADIESQPLPLGRADQSVEDRNPVLFVEITDLGSLSPEGPSPLKVRDEQEPTFVEKDQVGFEPFGVFLYAAKCNASSGQWLPRPFAGLAALVSGNSCPGWTEASRYDNDGNSRQNVCESAGQHALASKGLLNNQQRAVPQPNTPKVFLSEMPKAWVDVPALIEKLTLPHHSFGRSPTNGRLNSEKNLQSQLPPTTFCRLLKAGWRADAASPGVLDFRLVSCTI